MGEAGAGVAVISSPSGIGISMDADHDHPPEELLPFFAGMDIVLAEGYKRGNTAKIEVFRPDIHKELLCGNDPRLIAVVSDSDAGTGVPRFLTANIRGLADFLISRYALMETLPEKKQQTAV